MNWLNRLGLKKTLIVSMLAVGVLPLVLGSLFVLMQADTGLERQAFNQLESVRQAREKQVESYFQTIAGQNRTMAETTTVIEAAKAFRSALDRLPDELNLNADELALERDRLSGYYFGDFATQYAETNEAEIDVEPLIPTDPISVSAQYRYIAANSNPLGLKDNLDAADDGSTYSRVHAEYHPIFRSFLHEFEFYDVFIVDPESGRIVYSVYKELDFATSLKTGVYSNTNFADAFRAATEADKGGAPTLVDFAPYTPSYEAAASFISQPIYDGSTLVGVLIFQMPVGRINEMMNAAAGMGETGETYLIGPDYLLRSQSRFSEAPTMLVKEVKRDDIDAALRGDISTTAVAGEGGEQLLASTAPLEIAGLDWAVVAEITSSEALSTITTLQRTTLITLAITIAAIVGFALWFSGKIYRQLGGDPSTIERIARSIGAGRLTSVGNAVRDKTTGALGELYDMQVKLTEVITKAKETAERVRSGASELSQGNKGLSQRTEEQAAGLEETASSMEEMTSTVKQTAENTRQAKELADLAKVQAEHGGRVVSSAIDAIVEIDASSEKIANITGVIDNIAFQTNLLALNASVEAARAGEQGHAFGVVADEVRKLAGRSASSAKEIKALIEDSVGKVKTGRRLASESGESLQEILASIQKVTEIVDEISTAGMEQSAGIEQINQALMHIDSTTQRNAEQVGEAASTAESMFSQANGLAEVMRFFEIDGSGQGFDSDKVPIVSHRQAERSSNRVT